MKPIERNGLELRVGAQIFRFKEHIDCAHALDVAEAAHRLAQLPFLRGDIVRLDDGVEAMVTVEADANRPSTVRVAGEDGFIRDWPVMQCALVKRRERDPFEGAVAIEDWTRAPDGRSNAPARDENSTGCAACDPEVYERGEQVLVTAGPAWLIEAWVKRIREMSEQRVDWHYAGGRAVVLCIGDASRVAACIAQCPLPGSSHPRPAPTSERDAEREMLTSLAATFEHAARNRLDARGGQHVTYTDDFASITTSTAFTMRRWARDIRALLDSAPAAPVADASEAVREWAKRIREASRLCSAHQFYCPDDCPIGGFDVILARVGPPPDSSAAMKERCARECEAWSAEHGLSDGARRAASAIASRIRALGPAEDDAMAIAEACMRSPHCTGCDGYGKKRHSSTNWNPCADCGGTGKRETAQRIVARVRGAKPERSE